MASFLTAIFSLFVLGMLSYKERAKLRNEHDVIIAPVVPVTFGSFWRITGYIIYDYKEEDGEIRASDPSPQYLQLSKSAPRTPYSLRDFVEIVAEL